MFTMTVTQQQAQGEVKEAVDNVWVMLPEDDVLAVIMESLT